MKYKYIVRNWGSKNTQKLYSKKIDLWIKNFNDDNKNLILFLLEKFSYYDKKIVNKRVKELFEVYKEYNPNYKNDTIFIKPLKEYGVSYSSFVFNDFWFANHLYDNCEENICELLMNKEYPKTISIVDDYAGTGNTIISTLIELFSLDNDSKIEKYDILCIHITDEAAEKISEFGKKNNRNVKIYSLDKTRKVFEKNYYFNDGIEQVKKNEYLSICEEFNIVCKLGFEETQSLVSFYYNTPNNTLGLFWNEINNDCLFNRYKKSRNSVSELRKKAKMTKKINKMNKELDINLKCEEIFALYCSAHTNDFSFNDFCETFGLTEKQAHKFIDIQIEKKLINLINGKIILSDKIKKYSEFKKVFKNSNFDVTFNDSDYIPKQFEI